MKTIKKRKGCTPKARKLREKRKAANGPDFGILTKRVLDRVRGDGPPIRDVLVTPLADQEGLRCKKHTCQKLAANRLTWLFWHKGAWRTARRELCGRHTGGLANRLNRAGDPR